VDAGSRLLLRSLDVSTLPATGHALDFGCGYGVLGLAFREAMPGWTVDLVDRDALAVAFSAWNAERLGLDDGSVRCAVGLGVDLAPPEGCDLILWNVPGKAGGPVLAALSADVAGALAVDGLAALVVVNPLAPVIREALAGDPGIVIAHDEAFPEHTVIHARRTTAAVPNGDPFARGVFDRDLAGFGVDEFDYDITTVVGIPEYDTYSFATQVVFDTLRTVTGEVGAVLVMRPGQGHVPLVAVNQFRPELLMLVDRDQLALRASLRAFEATEVFVPQIEAVAGIDLEDVGFARRYGLAVLMLEEQVRNEVHIARLADLASLVAPGGNVIVGATSSVVSRFLSFAAKQQGWKVRDRVKRSGASAARLEWVG
jgi:16S rRNA G1207 methylase RsmC